MIQTCLGSVAGTFISVGPVKGGPPANQPYRGQIGIVSASLAAQILGRATDRHISLLDLPSVLSEELEMTVLDLNTSVFSNFATVSADLIETLRAKAERARCQITNLKMNQPALDIASPDRELRRRSLKEYKRSIDIAADLGCRWARPLPLAKKPDEQQYVASYQELCEYGHPKGIQLLVENYGWVQADAAALPRLVKAIGRNVAACPDTGNWENNEVRGKGLENAFPVAASCDFKVKGLDADGRHPAYDLQRCFNIAWENGFRGPWAIEHAHIDTTVLFRELRQIGQWLREWTAEQTEDV